MMPSRRTISARSGSDLAMASRISVSIPNDYSLTGFAQDSQGVDGVVTAARGRMFDDDAVGNQSVDVGLHGRDHRLVHGRLQRGDRLGAKPAAPGVAAALGAVQREVRDLDGVFPAHRVGTAGHEGQARKSY